MADSGLRERVEECVADIPPGRVMTYGDIAAACGHPGAARMVGAIAHDGAAGLPWHRVVRSGGLLAQTADYGNDEEARELAHVSAEEEAVDERSEEHGDSWQRDALAAEGVALVNDRVAGFAQRRWWPEEIS